MMHHVLHRGRTAALLGLLWTATGAVAAGQAGVTDQEAAGALRETLARAAGAAIDELGVTDGFLGDPEVRIGLPRKLRKAEPFLRMVGRGKDIDDLVAAMNHAAEAAVPEARTLLAEAVAQMSIQDAAGIIAGGDDAATRYFEAATRKPLTEKFLPIIRERTALLGVAENFNKVAGAAAQFGWVTADEANLEQYVASKALDGLYLKMAEQERAMRNDPLGQAGELLRRVLGSPGN